MEAVANTSPHSPLASSFTSTGEKLFWHQEAMQGLRDGRGMPICLHLIPSDVCQDTCAMCSVMTREGKILLFGEINGILDQLVPLGLKSVIISGGGNPILYKCPETKKNFNDLVDEIHSRGLQIGLITNGLKLKDYPCGRKSWITVKPETLDKFTWVRVSMSGLDHERREVEVPDIDQEKTTLGFSYIYHDIYHSPNEPNHGKVSTLKDFHQHEGEDAIPQVEYGEDRLPWLETQIKRYIDIYKPSYCRLLCDCLEPSKIPERHKVLSEMANRIAPGVAFSQFKPPRQPKRCFKGYPHPVVNSDGYLYFCDSVVLNQDAGHKFANKWRVCHWKEITDLYSKPVKPGVPNDICPGCVFSDQVDLIASVVDGMETPAPSVEPQHSAFI